MHIYKFTTYLKHTYINIIELRSKYVFLFSFSILFLFIFFVSFLCLFFVQHFFTFNVNACKSIICCMLSYMNRSLPTRAFACALSGELRDLDGGSSQRVFRRLLYSIILWRLILTRGTGNFYKNTFVGVKQFSKLSCGFIVYITFSAPPM